MKRTALVSLAAAAILGMAAGTGGAQSASKTTLVSGQALEDALHAHVSANGRYVAFETGAALTPEDINTTSDIYVYDRQLKKTERASVSSSEFEGLGESTDPYVSSDGKYVAFVSDSDNLVAGDINGANDVFVRDRTAGTTQRVSLSSSEFEGIEESLAPSISNDGRYVAFESANDTFAPGDANGMSDVFVRDRTAGTTERVSVGGSGIGSIDGSLGGAISGDGRYVAFESAATEFVPGDINEASDIFVRDRTLKKTERVSVSSSEFEGLDESIGASISSDGRYVAFESAAAEFAPGDLNGKGDVFVRDRTAGTTERVSVGASGVEGKEDSIHSSISPDGRYVAFESKNDNFATGDIMGKVDVFVRDRTAKTTTRASVDNSGAEADGESYAPSAGPGGLVAFESLAKNLGNASGKSAVYTRGPDYSATTPPPGGGGGTTGAPTITSVAPAEGVSARPLTQTIRAVFNEPMDPNTINTSSVVVSKRVTSSTGAISWTPVSGTVTYNATTKLATFTPTGGLSPASKYKANVNVKAKDAGGTPLDVNPTLAGSQGKVWYFSTVS